MHFVLAKPHCVLGLIIFFPPFMRLALGRWPFFLLFSRYILNNVCLQLFLTYFLLLLLFSHSRSKLFGEYWNKFAFRSIFSSREAVKAEYILRWKCIFLIRKLSLTHHYNAWGHSISWRILKLHHVFKS